MSPMTLEAVAIGARDSAASLFCVLNTQTRAIDGAIPTADAGVGRLWPGCDDRRETIQLPQPAYENVVASRGGRNPVDRRANGRHEKTKARLRSEDQ